MKKLALFLISLSIVLMACNRKTTLKGRVLNPITNEGIEGATIAASRSTLEIPGGYKLIAQTTSDANGDFVLEFKKSASEIGVSTGNYYDIGWYQNGEKQPGYKLPVQQGKNMHADFYAVSYGKLQINIKNTNCFNQDDTLSIFRTHSIPGFYDDVPNPAVYTGCVDQEGNMNKAPMGWYKFKGTVTKNGIETPIKDSIYLDEGATKVWKIYY